MAATAERERNIQVLRGFLHASAQRDAAATSSFLDCAVEDAILAASFPTLQTSVLIDERGIERLESAIRLGLAASWTYSHLAYGKATEPIPIAALRRLVLAIATLPHGYGVATEIFGMKLHSARSNNEPIDRELILCGQELISLCSFGDPGHMLDYHLGEIITACFVGTDAASAAGTICRRLNEGLLNYTINQYNYQHVFSALFNTQPIAALDAFLGDGEPGAARRLFAFRGAVDDGSAIALVPDDLLLTWAQHNPPRRLPLIAALISPFTTNNNHITWSPIALQILSIASDRVTILREFVRHLIPLSGREPLTEIIESRRALIEPFLSDNDVAVADWARERVEEMTRWAEQERVSDRPSNESFE